MKSKKIIQVCLLIIFYSVNNYAQDHFNIDYDEIKGKLSKSDKYKADFGKYHGYELPLYEGETANFAIYSNEFDARIILVNPQGKVFKQSGNPTNGFTSLITEIPTSGDWILYVVGNQKDNGSFILRYAFANANSFHAPSIMDLCSTINFLVAHANAHFMMLQVSSALPKLPNSLESFIDNQSGAFVNIISSGSELTIRNQFEEYLKLLQSCLPDWKTQKVSASKNQFQSADQSKIGISFEYNPVLNEKDKYDLIMKIVK